MARKKRDGKAEKRKWKEIPPLEKPTQHGPQYDKPMKFYPTQNYVENWERIFGKDKQNEEL
jgi:hypothetical protein